MLTSCDKPQLGISGQDKIIRAREDITLYLGIKKSKEAAFLAWTASMPLLDRIHLPQIFDFCA